jgi:hypothetical protein
MDGKEIIEKRETQKSRSTRPILEFSIFPPRKELFRKA